MHTNKKIYINSGINNVIRLLTLSDIFTWGAYYTISSIAGIYLAQKLGDDVVKYVGIGSGIYFISRALFQIPIGMFTDKMKSDHDEILILFVGCLLMGLPYLFYPLITSQYFYYFLQFIFGLGCSMNLNTWRKLFAKNLEINREGKAYAFYEAVMSIATAVLIIIGGLVANINIIYFGGVIVSVGLFMMIGGFAGGLIYLIKDRKKFPA